MFTYFPLQSHKINGKSYYNLVAAGRTQLDAGPWEAHAYFDNMSKLLDQVIRQRKTKAINYEEYIKKIAEVSKKVTNAIRERFAG